MPDKFTPFSEPYSPNLVPQATLQGDPNAQLIDLERFLGEELDRIQTAIQFVPVQAAYGSLFTNQGAVNQPLGNIPQSIESFTDTAPQTPNRIALSINPDEMINTEGGVYFIQSFTTADIEAGVAYGLEVYINNIASGIVGAVDSSNQTTEINISMYGLRELDPGNIITLQGVADGPGGGPWDFTVTSATFCAVRVSELHGRDASAIP